MRHALIACLAALLGALSVVGPARSEPAALPPEVALKRVNLLVRDIERSLAIYRDILGFRIFQCSDSSPQSYSYPVFRIPAAAKLHFCTLDSTTEVRALALTQVTGVELPPHPPLHLSAPVIRVERFDEVHAKAGRSGDRGGGGIGGQGLGAHRPSAGRRPRARSRPAASSLSEIGLSR
jgi:catechol 2,3-dioxygenase-like lactoylglutathione lyase family enzyme